MIAAGLLLLAVGASDLVRAFLFARHRWIGLLAGAIVLVALAAFSGALPAAALALLVAAAWIWLSPVGLPARAGFWPVVVLGALCAALVAAFPPRDEAGLIGEVFAFATPLGVLTIDHVVLLVGTGVFLLESANVVVRTALAQEDVPLAQVAADAATDAPATDAAPDPVAHPEAAHPETPQPGPPHREPAAHLGPTPSADAVESVPPQQSAPLAMEPALKGGRLIGPLERLLVFALTLAAMYPLLAAILAAKGIVRFPEISRDSAAGNRAEYFLIGSLVSWVQALAAALLVWWAFATPVP